MQFSSTCLVGTKRNDNFYFPYFSSFSDLFWLEMNHHRISFIFWIFYYFYGIFYYASVRNETKRNDNFYFLSFPTFSNLFWLIMKPHWYFWIFLPFFWNFLSRLGQEWNGMIIFIFSSSQSFPTYFGLKWSHNCIF